MRAVSKSLAVLATSVLLLAGCTAQNSGSSAYEDKVGLQMFMWNWKSIAAECEFLGDAGVDWVLTSPPQEHITGAAWWTVYQPVSYQIESRLGTRAQFADMVSSCKKHGVEIIADAVINHMSAQTSGTGYAGTQYTKYEYPGLYSRADFHNCNLTPNDQIQNYRDLAQVQNCELLGLSDLDQKQANVQKQILAYLNDLLSLGVAGFRIDAAKHIFAPDLKVIIDQLPAGTRIIHEVIRGGGEPVQPEQYLDSGEVWEFDYARALKSYVKGEVITPAGSPIRFRDYTPSNQTVAFVSNHDTERNGETINYRDIKDFELATALMLAENYGQPMLYSSYAFSSKDAGPYETVKGVGDVSCGAKGELLEPSSDYKSSEWICQHRFSSTVNMIGFRKAVAGTDLTLQYRERGVYGFARGNKGYFILNVFKSKALDIEVETGLKDGEYTNLFDGKKYLIENGTLKTKLEPKSAIALLDN
jgi:alpha-amylase